MKKDFHIDSLNNLLNKYIKEECYEKASEIKEELEYLQKNQLEFIRFESTYLNDLSHKERMLCYEKKKKGLNYIEEDKINPESYGEEILEKFCFMEERVEGSVKTIDELNEKNKTLKTPDEKLAALFSLIENKPYEDVLFDILITDAEKIINNISLEFPEKKKELETFLKETSKNKDIDKIKDFNLKNIKYNR